MERWFVQLTQPQSSTSSKDAQQHTPADTSTVSKAEFSSNSANIKAIANSSCQTCSKIKVPNHLPSQNQARQNWGNGLATRNYWDTLPMYSHPKQTIKQNGIYL